MFRRFHLQDWRHNARGLVHELNFIGRKWNLRIMLPNFGFCLWKDYERVAGYNYTGPWAILNGRT